MAKAKKANVTKRDVVQVEQLLVETLSDDIRDNCYVTATCVNEKQSNYRVNFWRKSLKEGAVIDSHSIYNSMFIRVTQVRDNVPKYKVIA